LAPLEFVVTLLSAIILASILVIIPISVFGSGSFLGLGDPDACTTTSENVVGVQGTSSGDGAESSVVPGLHDDASAVPRQIGICERHPTAGVKAASAGERATGLLLLLGFLVLARVTIVAARRDGLFSRTTATRTRALGWYLVLGSLGAATVASLLSGVVVSSSVDDIGWTDGLRGFDMPWTLVVVGIGVITVARVLRQAVALQDDVDATI
jgi:hypothetical protein